MMLRTTLSALGFAVLGAGALGCAARGGATVVADATYVAEPGYASGVDVIIEEPAPQRVVFREPPPLVVVESDVYVVENASYPIYFVDGFYWHVGSAGHWYRASRWDEPWVTVQLGYVPTRIVHRDHHSYVHFRASASAKVWRQPRERGERALREVRRDERKARVERRVDRRVEHPTPAAGPRPNREVRRDRDDERGRANDDRRVVPRVDRDVDRKRVDPPRAEPRRAEPPRAAPRPEVDRDRPRALPEARPDVDDARKPGADPTPRRPDVDQARPDGKKKVLPKKPDDKPKPKDPGRGRPSRR